MDELAAIKAGPLPLSDKNLPHLPESVIGPGYDRSKLTPGIVHIGVGNFHRAHQAWYLHQLMQQGLAHDWAILGAGVRSYDADMRAKLLAQDCLTTLIELAPDSSRVEVIGSMIDYVPVVDSNTALIEAMARPDIRIVAMTVTEGGYYLDQATGAFDPDHPDIDRDARNPREPQTAFGAIIEALRQRRGAGHGPMTVLSCDNLQGNGQIVRRTIVGLAALSDAELAHWIDTHCTFPNSMVDSIVPATGPEERELARSFGIADDAPVTHENFRQWVIEDAFCAGRPAWDKAGATFTNDVHGYEAMKLRILNAGHQILANAGELLSQPTIDTCIGHPSIGAFFHRVQTQEILPHVADVPGMTTEAYLAQVTKRFQNPAVKDTTRRVAFDGSSRHTGFVLPILRDALDADAPVDGLALTEALWARMCFGVREDGTVIDANDPHWGSLQEAARASRERPSAWLDQASIYGDLREASRFADAFERWLAMIWQVGTQQALDRYYSGATER